MSQYESYPSGPEQQGYGGQPMKPEVPSSAKTMSIIGIVLGVLAILFLPIVLGPIGAILGFVAQSKGDAPRGKYVGIFCIVTTIVGMILGAVVFSSMMQ